MCKSNKINKILIDLFKIKCTQITEIVSSLEVKIGNKTKVVAFFYDQAFLIVYFRIDIAAIDELVASASIPQILGLQGRKNVNLPSSYQLFLKINIYPETNIGRTTIALDGRLSGCAFYLLGFRKVKIIWISYFNLPGHYLNGRTELFLCSTKTYDFLGIDLLTISSFYLNSVNEDHLSVLTTG